MALHIRCSTENVTVKVFKRTFKLKDKLLEQFYEKKAQEFNCEIIDILLHGENSKGIIVK